MSSAPGGSPGGMEKLSSSISSYVYFNLGIHRKSIPSESASLSTSPGNKAKIMYMVNGQVDFMSGNLTSFYVRHPWWCHTEWIHNRVIVNTAFRMPRKTFLIEQISSFLSRQFRLRLVLFSSPVNKTSSFRVLRNIFCLFPIYLLQFCFQFGKFGLISATLLKLSDDLLKFYVRLAL